MSKQAGPQFAHERANARATWFAYQILLFLNEKRTASAAELRAFIAGLPLKVQEATVDSIIKYLLRLTAIDTRGASRGTLYFMTVYGEGLLREYVKLPPPMPKPSKNDEEV